MGASTGLGLLDLAILEACEAAEAMTDALMVRTDRVLDLVCERVGVGPRTAYEPLCAMARPWVLHLGLISVHGNYGSLDSPPANPRYTSCRLSPLGAASLASERGSVGPLPIGLINGNTHDGGVRPPLDPRRTVMALRAASQESPSDEELVQMVGPPSFPTGCDVAVDMASFAAGRETDLRLSARVVAATDRLLVTNLPPDSSPEEIAGRLGQRVRQLRSQDPADPHTSASGIRRIRNESTSSDGSRLIIEFARGSDPAPIVELLGTVWGISQTKTVKLERPLASLLRAAVADPVRLDQRLELIEAATR